MSKKLEIIPAVLSKDFADLEEHIELIKGMVKTIQIDVCDGQFVRNASWPYKKRDDSFEKILKEADGLPGWQVTNFEIDLMANHPEEIVDEWVSAGASRIIIHVEAVGDISAAIKSLIDKVEVGLAINLDSPLEMIAPYASDIKFIQFMGIDNIGFQGQKFDEAVIAKIKEARIKFPDLIISVDGGVSLETAPELIEAGATRLVVGSAIFGSENAIEAIQRFKKLTVL